MKLTTVGLAIALALPGTSAFAEGTLNYSTAVARPVVRGVKSKRHSRGSPVSSRFYSDSRCK
jgi:hypothetical protein